jgi:predicted nicotinamide N-methyase
LAFSDYILNNADEFKSKNILELGCGIGLVGIAATMAGAEVTFSDYEYESLNFTQNNYFLNFRERAKTLLLDWRKPNLNKQFEIIIASDILYEKRFLKPVYDTLNMLLAETGMVYIAEPNRTIAKPFFEMMKYGYTELINFTLKYNNKSVTLYKFQKC